LTNVLGRLRHTYVKDGVKNYEGPTTSWENAIRKFPPYVFKMLVWLWPEFSSVLEPSVTSNAQLRFSIFSNQSHFCMWNFVSADKAKLNLSTETKFHIQKCNTYSTYRYREKPYRTIFQWYSTISTFTVWLSGRKLAHNTRAARVRGVS
jgi:hypothetical protein